MAIIEAKYDGIPAITEIIPDKFCGIPGIEPSLYDYWTKAAVALKANHKCVECCWAWCPCESPKISPVIRLTVIVTFVTYVHQVTQCDSSSIVTE